MSDPKFTTEDEAVHTQPLQRPISAFGKQLDVLYFREPRAGDITRHGRPVNYTPGYDFSSITFDEAKMTAMLAALSGVPQSSIDFMTTQDWTECAWGVSRFFIPGVSTTRAGQGSNLPNTSAVTSSDTSIDQTTSS